MGGFRRVEADQAGPAALGILIPPGARTLVVLRPRGLAIDAVLCRRDDLQFVHLSHDEASAAAQALYRGLQAGHVTVHNTAGRLLVALPNLALVVCPRQPGQPYQPLEGTEAERWSVPLTELLHPTGDQEVYFNTRFFER